MRRQGWWTRWATKRLIAAALVTLVAGVVQAMDRYDIRQEWKWLHSNRMVFGTVVVAGVLVLVNTVGDVIAQRQALAGEARRVDIHKAATAALVALSELTKLKITDLGANVFLVKRTRRWQRTIRGKEIGVGRRPRLERVERIRLADSPAMSAVRWTEGKGVIGECWKNERPEHVHWAPLAKRWEGKTITDAQWDRIKQEDKAGFSREDFITMVGKYAEIMAVPIKDGQGKTIGVVAVDRAWRADVPQHPMLRSAHVEEMVTSTATVLQNVLGAR